MTRTRSAAMGLLVVAAMAAVGCGSQKIETAYGRRRGAEARESVNGTAVLAGMFEQAGHRVTSRSYLSPKMREYEVIVWFPDDFEPPRNKQHNFLEDWLSDGPGRTLIYVGRDYDASLDYWEKALPGAPADQSVEMLRRKAHGQSAYDQRRMAMPAAQDGRWFRVSRDHETTYIGRRQAGPSQLTGTWCAAGDVDAARVDIQVRGRLQELQGPPVSKPRKARPRPPQAPFQLDFDAEDEEEALDRYDVGQYRSKVLLASGELVLVREVTNTYWSSSKILVVTNGSFLLNWPLVEREHRKLAGKLIAECGPAPKKIAFLESSAGGPTVYKKEPGEGYPTGFEAFTVWPLGAILMHFIILGTVLLAGRIMIFGRPHELPRPPVSDFGHHIEALGDLIARTQDHRYAEQRLADYHDKVKRETGPPSSPSAAG